MSEIALRWDRILVVVFMFLGLGMSAEAGQKHEAWDRVLKKYVSVSGAVSVVDYESLKKNRAELDHYIENLQLMSHDEFAGLLSAERLAFLINAYNALTIQLVINNYPGIQSIKDIKAPFHLIKNPTRNPWKYSFFKLFKEDQTLDNIEHVMIRKNFDEPRIHFALVCAAKSCPGLRAEAFVANRLEAQLEDSANRFLKDEKRNRFSRNDKTLYLSSIFKWYGGDFGKSSGAVKAFVASRIARTPEEANLILSDDVKIEFLNYDWSLNSK